MFKVDAIDSTQKTACRKVPFKMGELQPVSSNKRLKIMLSGSFQEMIMTPQHQLPHYLVDKKNNCSVGLSKN